MRESVSQRVCTTERKKGPAATRSEENAAYEHVPTPQPMTDQTQAKTQAITCGEA